MTIELLGRVCAESVGKLKHSVFNQLQGFEATERDLRREMDYLRSSAHRDLQIEVCYMYLTPFLLLHVLSLSLSPFLLSLFLTEKIKCTKAKLLFC